MISSPSSPYQQLNQPAAVSFVRVKGDNDMRFEPGVFPVATYQFSGGKRDDVITLQILKPEPILDSDLTGWLGKEIELWVAIGRPAGDGGQALQLVQWGVICQRPIRVDDQADTFALEARIGDEHFGNRLQFIPTFDIVGRGRLDVMQPLVFNPEIDGIIEPNMSGKVDDDHQWHYFLDPESTRTDASRQKQAYSQSRWKLSDAVLLLCWLLNPNETYIKNPTRQELDGVFRERNDLLKNVSIPYGSSLPDCLDILLKPLEYDWKVYYSGDGRISRNSTSFTRRTMIKFFQRGRGPKKQLFLQRPDDGQGGRVRDISKTTLLGFAATVSTTPITNRVVVFGSVEKREITTELVKAWSTQFDKTRLVDLHARTEFSKSHPEVGRKWVWNEAADYIGTPRDGGGFDRLRPEITDPPPMTGLFADDHVQLKRRQFLRCLTQHPDGEDRESNGFRVEWYNAKAKGAVDPATLNDPGWQIVKSPFSVLEKECGIVFDGETPPMELWDLIYSGNPDKARVRITATVCSDNRIKGDATRQATSLCQDDKTLVLEMPDKFEDSRVVTIGRYKSIFAENPTDARNDTEAIQKYAELVRDAEDYLRADINTPLEGVFHPEYQIGDVLASITWRNVSLRLKHPNVPDSQQHYPQIVGKIQLFQEQRSELVLESLNKERPRIVRDDRKTSIVNVNDAHKPRPANPRQKTSP